RGDERGGTLDSRLWTLDCPVRGDPHPLQNLLPGGLGVAQVAQMISSLLPHSLQNLAPSLSSCPQREQRISLCSPYPFFFSRTAKYKRNPTLCENDSTAQYCQTGSRV